MKTHFKITGVDCRKSHTQTEFEYSHQTACGYVRDKVTESGVLVDCKHCLRSVHMEIYHKLNDTFSDSQGCY